MSNGTLYSFMSNSSSQFLGLRPFRAFGRCFDIHRCNQVQGKYQGARPGYITRGRTLLVPKHTAQGEFRLVFFVDYFQATKFNDDENRRDHKQYDTSYSQCDTPINFISYYRVNRNNDSQSLALILFLLAKALAVATASSIGKPLKTTKESEAKRLLKKPGGIKVDLRPLQYRE
jgi:hypothetical protein